MASVGRVAGWLGDLGVQGKSRGWGGDLERARLGRCAVHCNAHGCSRLPPQVWSLVSWAVAPLEQAALTHLTRAKGWRRNTGVRLLLKVGLAVGIVVGAGLAIAVSAAPSLLSRDEAVWGHMVGVASLAGASLVISGADAASSGVNLALGDADYMARSFAATLAVLSGFMWVSHASGWGLQGVWWGLVLFFGVRAVQSAGRVMLKHLAGDGSGGSSSPPAAAAPAAALA